MDTPTDSGSESPTSSSASRRQFAYYPNMNSSNKPLKPFSRSAAKRESVMALGSIEHLQHYFTKTGIAAETNPSNKPNNGMVPAIGGLIGKTGRPWPAGVPEFQLPPSPVVPQIIHPITSPYVKTYEIDPENLRPSVIEDLGAVEQAWWLSGVEQADLLSVPDAQGGKGTTHVDVLDVLRTTTHAVRSVRNYLLSLPDDGPTPVKPQFQFRTSVLSAPPPPRRQASQPDSASDPLSRIRRSALEVLTVLRSVEEASRLPLSDDAYDAQSDHGDHTEAHSVSGSTVSRATSPDFLGDDVETPVSISYVHVGGRHGPVPVWEDEDDFDLNQATDPEQEKRERWDERLVLGGGWLYKQDVTRQALATERGVVARYLDAVDDVLFGGRKEGKRGWEREREKAERERRSKGRRVSAGDAELVQTKRSNRRVVSAGMFDAMRGMALTEEPEEGEMISEAESVDDEELPDWARRNLFVDDNLGRLHALLQALVPGSLLHLLPRAPPDRAVLLQALSSGQLLCSAYNIGVRKSRKPWGFVNKDAIHDIAALEAQSVAEGEQEQARKGWTFRRTDNLRLWAAALKLRYSLPVHTPASGKLAPKEGTTPVGSPSTPIFRFPTAELPITFDAPLIARHEPGWEDMLEQLAMRWMQAVVDEKRGRDPRT
ncbi:hypothetical protein PHLGIDRAFT_70384 [Phlebiopsis gigantea 11061_1 CR5-6]|uniref:Uncharacterized protein n=1 Tax=Phlebiopsis gigantea (strain 11061_1 CR5-6) TaxID=745531 RepID=A0A0C3NRP5_PHLG1|nr:hypothetical protein PHLGIDRAFT_70384 [Phlebiopsis gigantea 11061_1 CR5-6]